MGKNTQVDKSLLKDDLYQAVNGAWLKTAVIPADKSTTGGFADLADNIEKLLMADFEALLENDATELTPEMHQFVKFVLLLILKQENA